MKRPLSRFASDRTRPHARPFGWLALACALVTTSSAGLVGCNLSREAHAAETAPAEAAAAAAPAPKSEKAEHSDDKDKATKPKFGVPFVREEEADLRSAHSFLRTLTHDNERFVKATGAKHFSPFVDKQKPRATVVTCSDSRVQTPAFDADPENDVFTVRNIGNQVVNADGSVHYGVEHLKTPVLFIMGHTGCGAVKAAMGDISKQQESIRKELETLHTEKKSNSDDSKVWLEAVVANVNDQVLAALDRFPNEVAQGHLVIVGGVYDLRNDLRDGYGKVHIVNVNGQTDAKKLKSFGRAIAREMPALEDADSQEKEGPETRDSRDAKEPRGTRETLRDALRAAPKEMKDGNESSESRDPKGASADKRERREAPSSAAEHKDSKR